MHHRLFSNHRLLSIMLAFCAIAGARAAETPNRLDSVVSVTPGDRVALIDVCRAINPHNGFGIVVANDVPAGTTVKLTKSSETVRELLDDVSRQSNCWWTPHDGFVILARKRFFIYTLDLIITEETRWRQIEQSLTAAVPAECHVTVNSFVGLITADLTPAEHSTFTAAVAHFGGKESSHVPW